MATFFYKSSQPYITLSQDDGFGNLLKPTVSYKELMGAAWAEAADEYFFLTGKDLM